jgi:hypothetical protein
MFGVDDLVVAGDGPLRERPWRASAACIASVCSSHMRVDDLSSVKRKVTVSSAVPSRAGPLSAPRDARSR